MEFGLAAAISLAAGSAEASTIPNSRRVKSIASPVEIK
jgi:hypothetical protein